MEGRGICNVVDKSETKSHLTTLPSFSDESNRSIVSLLSTSACASLGGLACFSWSLQALPTIFLSCQLLNQMASASSETIFLQPRPYAQRPGKLLLLPLLPFRKPLKALPAEVWGDIFAFAVACGGREVTTWALSYLTICKSLKVSLFLNRSESKYQIPLFVTLKGCCSPSSLLYGYFYLDQQLRGVFPTPLRS